MARDESNERKRKTSNMQFTTHASSSIPHSYVVSHPLGSMGPRQIDHIIKGEILRCDLFESLAFQHTRCKNQIHN